MKTLVNAIKPFIHPLNGERDDYDPLVQRAGDADFVLLGAQTHGTHEFYRERARITQRLITEKDFNAVAVEADWPDAYRVNRYIQGRGDDPDAVDALGDFTFFPRWLWRNADMIDFVGALKAHNDSLLSSRHKVGFYGLDLYGLHKSIDAVIGYLENVDPAAAKEARARYSSFDHFGSPVHRYGLGATIGATKSAEEDAVRELLELRRRHADWLRRNRSAIAEDLFYAEQSAQLIEDAERYYRAMFSERTAAWNQREAHMMKVLAALASHLRSQHGHAKIVVWSHNMHVGDARGTEFGKEAQVSLGQLLHERYAGQAMSVGFTTDSGTVTAARDWCDSPPERMLLKPALQDSYEAVFHQAEHSRFLLDLYAPRWDSTTFAKLRQTRLERSIGVVYSCDAELEKHYCHAQLPDQFDAVIHIDVTRAVEPLERTADWDKAEVPETFPMGV